jgi:RNA polymerase sigma factor (sigma-70 family)
MLEKFHQGDRRAGNRLVESNLKFVAAVARKYLGRGLSFDDLMAEGAMGMQVAVEKFDPSSQLRLVSYAVWWIRQKIIMALAEQPRVVNIPHRMLGLMKKLEAARGRIEQDRERPATLEEIAQAVKMNPREIASILPAMTPSINFSHQMNGDGQTIEDMLEAPGSADDWAAAGMLERFAEKLSQCLTPSEREIWKGCYGLDGEAETLDSIGQRRGISRERVRQKRKHASQRVQHRARALGGV